jgi:hypothetical protein
MEIENKIMFLRKQAEETRTEDGVTMTCKKPRRVLKAVLCLPSNYLYTM